MNSLEIIYKNNKPYGIRDEGGFLFFFTKITKHTGQEERYRQEIEEQFELADFLLETLKEKETKSMYGLERENAEFKRLGEYQSSIIIHLNSENSALKGRKAVLLETVLSLQKDIRKYKALKTKDKKTNGTHRN